MITQQMRKTLRSKNTNTDLEVQAETTLKSHYITKSVTTHRIKVFSQQWGALPFCRSSTPLLSYFILLYYFSSLKLKHKLNTMRDLYNISSSPTIQWQNLEECILTLYYSFNVSSLLRGHTATYIFFLVNGTIYVLNYLCIKY